MIEDHAMQSRGSGGAGRAFSIKPLPASPKRGENKPMIIIGQKMVLDQHIQHLRRCAIIGARYPPVTQAAIHIQVLRTWRIYRIYRHYVALLIRNYDATKIPPPCGCI